MGRNDMVEIDNIIKREKRSDNIKHLFDTMDELSNRQEYEKAKEILDKIKEELPKPASNVWPYSYVPMGDIQTVKDVYDLIVSDPIRLSPKNYDFADFSSLVIAVHNRRDEIQGARYIDTDRQRKVVAEEMACLGIAISESRGGRGKVGRSEKPNRAFLDIAHRVNPSLACKELERREKVMMWKAIESGKKEEIEKVREKLKKYSGRNIYEEK